MWLNGLYIICARNTDIFQQNFNLIQVLFIAKEIIEWRFSHKKMLLQSYFYQQVLSIYDCVYNLRHLPYEGLGALVMIMHLPVKVWEACDFPNWGLEAVGFP